MERETKLNKEQLDYAVEESWRWAIACEALSMPPVSCTQPSLMPLLHVGLMCCKAARVAWCIACGAER